MGCSSVKVVVASAFGPRVSFGLRSSAFGFHRCPPCSPGFPLRRSISTALTLEKTRPNMANSTDFILQPKQANLSHWSANKIMALCLNKLTTLTPGCLLRKGPRVFALLGKATPLGLATFGPEDVGHSWALTAEFGFLRLERLSGEEEVTGEQLFLPLPADYNYGLAGPDQSPEMIRAVFGLLTSELEQLVSVLRRGGFPVLGFSQRDLRCSLTCCIIPGYWPHVVISNMALHGNVVSLEAFVRLMVSSLPQARLSLRFPELQPIFKRMMRLIVTPRRGIPYTREALALAPAPAPY